MEKTITKEFIDEEVAMASSLSYVRSLIKILSLLESYEDKLKLIETLSEVENFFQINPLLSSCLSAYSALDQYLVKSLIVIKQHHLLGEELIEKKELLLKTIEGLRQVELFYARVGGVLGYHKMALELLFHKPIFDQSAKIDYHVPEMIDVTSESAYLDEIIIKGIECLDKVGELYPVGGSADRLKLQDEKMHFDLPAARLDFLGRSLLEGMIRDVQAREYLYFKLFGKQVTTPIALMTSDDKQNHEHIKALVEESHYFGRLKDSFCFFSQPLVPTFTKEGKWCLKGPFELLLKPGGHGVIWRLAQEKKVFDWLEKNKVSKILVRQINNPIAGVDAGLIALLGIGSKEGKKFGFASCSRTLKTSEGINVLKKQTVLDRHHVGISCVEYCDFEKYGVEEAGFPANTNILFGDLSSVQDATKKIPYPGALINFKESSHYCSKQGEVVSDVARVELLMQGIVDAFVEEGNLQTPQDTFVTFNKRHKTISTTKKQFIPGSGLVETALGCFYDYLKNIRELMEGYCGFDMPQLPSEENFLKEGPSFIMTYHPALGPLYSVIGQKITQGKLGLKSELQLEIADVRFENLLIEGSLLIEAKQILGHYDEEGKLCYSSQTGGCYLKNVRICNKGIDDKAGNIFWKNRIFRREHCQIILEGHSEFVAEDVVFEGDFHITVPDGVRVVAKMVQDELVLLQEPLVKADSYYHYSIERSKIRVNATF